MVYFRRYLRCAQIALCSLLYLSAVQLANAHPPGLSSVDVLLAAAGMDVNITFAIDDIEAFSPMDSDFDAEVTPAEQEAAKPAIAAFVASEFKVAIDGTEQQPAPGVVDFDAQNNAHIALHFAQSPVSTLGITAEFLSKLSNGHKQYVSIKNATGELGQKMLTQQDNQLQFALGATSTTAAEPHASGKATFVEFLLLGIEHIVTGYDHLLFLFSLLVVTHSFWPAIKIITFFTIAHSITLALAGANILDIPSVIIEPFIAATIVYVGAENLLRGEHPKGRALLTFCFGLVHGFGFAGVLREMGITSGDSGILIPLFSFNLGVEIGQLSIAAVVLPLIWWLHTKPAIGKRLTPVGSALACLAGVYWFVERTLL